MLGDFLRIVQQFGGEFGIALGRVAARTRAGERTNRHDAIVRAFFLTHQNFRRRADHVHFAAEVVVVHVRRRIQRTQRAIQRKRVVAERLDEALADLHLHQFAGRDVFLRAAHGVQIVVLLELAEGLGAHARGRHRRLNRRTQTRAQFAQTMLRFGIRFGPGRIGVDDQIELAREVVDDRDFFGQQQLNVGQVEIVGRRGVRELLLDVAHRVITEVAGETAAETRQARTRRDFEALLILLDERERIAFIRLDDVAVRDDLRLAVLHAHGRAGRQPDERVAPEALAAHDGFQQERVRAVALGLRELEVERERRFEVGEGFGDERNAVVAFVRQRLEFEFGHVAILERRALSGWRGIGECRALRSVESRDDRIRRPRRFELSKRKRRLARHDTRRA